MSHKTPQTRNLNREVSFASPEAIAWMRRMRARFPAMSDADLRVAYRHFVTAEHSPRAKAA